MHDISLIADVINEDIDCIFELDTDLPLPPPFEPAQPEPPDPAYPWVRIWTDLRHGIINKGGSYILVEIPEYDQMPNGGADAKLLPTGWPKSWPLQRYQVDDSKDLEALSVQVIKKSAGQSSEAPPKQPPQLAPLQLRDRVLMFLWSKATNKEAEPSTYAKHGFGAVLNSIVKQDGLFHSALKVMDTAGLAGALVDLRGVDRIGIISALGLILLGNNDTNWTMTNSAAFELYKAMVGAKVTRPGSRWDAVKFLKNVAGDDQKFLRAIEAASEDEILGQDGARGAIVKATASSGMIGSITYSGAQARMRLLNSWIEDKVDDIREQRGK